MNKKKIFETIYVSTGLSAVFDFIIMSIFDLESMPARIFLVASIILMIISTIFYILLKRIK